MEIQLIVVFISAVQQSSSVICIRVYMYIPFRIPFHYVLLQDVEYSSLLYSAGLCSLSILYTVVCIC